MGVIKTRAIGGDAWRGKGESGALELSPGLSHFRHARAKARKRVFALDVAGIHVFFARNRQKDVDGRNKSGHDDREPTRVKAIVIAFIAAAVVSQANAQGLP